MRQLEYYVATSLDGYIEGIGGDISDFVAKGEGVERYQQDLANYDTVIMGRKTYEFGYNYGLSPGDLAYPHMEHYIISQTMRLAEHHERLHIIPAEVPRIMEIKEQLGSPIYLCGGGETAAWMLENNLIDRLKIKLNPMLIGAGTPLFGSSKMKQKFQLVDAEKYSDGLVILSYDLML